MKRRGRMGDRGRRQNMQGVLKERGKGRYDGGLNPHFELHSSESRLYLV